MKKMGRPNETKRVDSEKVKAILAKNHITMAKLSQDMGFHESYVSCLLRQGELSKYAVTYLKNTYGVSYSEYKYCSEEKQKAEQTEEVQTIEEVAVSAPDMSTITPVNLSDEAISKLSDKLDEVISSINGITDAIYKAVYGAVVAAWKDM